MNREDWTKSKCKCTYYQKNYYCYHGVAVAVSEGLFKIPDECKTLAIEQKKARGRKPLVPKALVREPDAATSSKKRVIKENTRPNKRVKKK